MSELFYFPTTKFKDRKNKKQEQWGNDENKILSPRVAIKDELRWEIKIKDEEVALKQVREHKKRKLKKAMV